MPLTVDFSVLPAAQRLLWPELANVPRDFVLYGGTAVALRVAHRVSIDFDFFTSESFDPFGLQASLGPIGEGQVVQTAANTLTLVLHREGEIKMSWFGGICGRVGHPDETADGVIRVASALDLLAHKLKVILQRAEARDYQDIAALLHAGVALDRGLGAAVTLFAPGFPVAECIKALGYFNDIAESQRLDKGDRALLIKAVQGLGKEIPDIPLAARDLA